MDHDNRYEDGDEITMYMDYDLDILPAHDVPTWIADMEFCHIVYDDETVALCGEPMHDDLTGQPAEYHGDYDNSAICSGCGRPTCPRCAQMSALEDSYDGS